MTIYTVKLSSGKSIRVPVTWIGAVPNSKKEIIRNIKALAAKQSSEDVTEIRRTMTNQLVWKKEEVDI